MNTKKRIGQLFIFYKKYIFQYISLLFLYVFIITFTTVFASVGYEDNFNYESQSFVRGIVKTLAAFLTFFLVCFIYVKIKTPKSEFKKIEVYHSSFYGKYWKLVTILTITIIIVSFYASRKFIYTMYSDSQINELLLKFIIITFVSFVLLGLSMLFYFIPIKAIYDFRKPILILRSFNDTKLSDNPKDEYELLISETTQRFRGHFPTILYDDIMTEIPVQHQFGSHRFLNQTNWLKSVEHIAKHSIAILIIPLHTEGILDEFNMLIKNDLTDKTYIMMLPESINFLSDKEVEKNWKHQRELFATSNIIFPAYQPEGMLFKLHEDVDSKNNIPLGYSINKTRKLIRHLKKRKRLQMSISIQSLIDQIQSFR
jgi:hypothetical protein